MEGAWSSERTKREDVRELGQVERQPQRTVERRKVERQASERKREKRKVADAAEAVSPVPEGTKPRERQEG